MKSQQVIVVLSLGMSDSHKDYLWYL